MGVHLNKKLKNSIDLLQKNVPQLEAILQDMQE